MLKNLSPLLVILLLVFLIWFQFYSAIPRNVESIDIPETEFSTMRAYSLVEGMAQAPHFVGGGTHSLVRNYIVDELQKMGLEVQTQEGYSLGNTGALSRSRNILTRISGTGDGKALLLMSHYDSAVHSSPGASDAASGVATILEGIRAFLARNETHQNDIIILITDAEEIGLLGAQLFTQNHEWAKDVGLALNFESRGSGGNSYMLLETNQGNAALIKAFKEANPGYPVTNSLAYSVYKMLPNDTDLTVLREQGNINGFNFAFIDDHFDYHTANDTPENLDKESLAHQGSYLVPLLEYFKDVDLTKLQATEDLVYFSIPGGEIVSYPFDWNLPLLVIAFIVFFGVVIFGIYKKRIHYRAVLKGAIPFLTGLLGSAVIIFLLWEFCLMIYPEYSEMEHGFTYNGYWYIGATIFLTLAINLFVYNFFTNKEKQAAYFVIPMFFWLIICTLTTLFLQGAAYFTILSFFASVHLLIMIKYPDPNRFLVLFFAIPALVIILPFLPTFPVALGLKILFVSALLTTFLFALLHPVFAYLSGKKALGIFSFLIFSILFITAHFKSGFTEERQKPNSLVYVLDADKNEATWNSYDNLIDPWLAPYFGDDPVANTETGNGFSSKYSSAFTYKATAPVISLAEPGIVFEQMKMADTLLKLKRYSLKIAPNRKVNRIELFADRTANFEEFRVNNLEPDSVYLGKELFHIFKKRWNNRLLTYHISNSDTLRIEFLIDPEKLPEFTLYEASYDLLKNSELKVLPREPTMIPRPFVLNDAVIIKKTISFSPETGINNGNFSDK